MNNNKLSLVLKSVRPPHEQFLVKIEPTKIKNVKKDKLYGILIRVWTKALCWWQGTVGLKIASGVWRDDRAITF